MVEAPNAFISLYWPFSTAWVEFSISVIKTDQSSGAE
jgi:hypothetical protein